MNANVLVIGAGGLGCPAILAAASRGVSRMTIFDPDRVEWSNLPRQILYASADVGLAKAEVAARWLSDRFPAGRIQGVPRAFGTSDAPSLAQYDVVLDCTDGAQTKLMISDLCVDAETPYVFGGVLGTSGQVLGVRPNASPCLRCIFDELTALDEPTCAETGVVGPVAGLIAARQVDEMFGLLAGRMPRPLYLYDGRTGRSRDVAWQISADCRGCGTRRALRGAAAGFSDPPRGIDAPELDLRHIGCPETFIRTRRRLSRLPAGGRLWIALGSDEAARGVPRSAAVAGHRVLARTFDGVTHRVLLEKGRDSLEGDLKWQ